MKLELQIASSVSLNKVDWDDAEKMCLNATRNFVKSLRLHNKRGYVGGAGTGFGRRDVSVYIPVREKELGTVLKHLPNRKFVMVDGVRIDVQYMRLLLESKHISASMKPLIIKNGVSQWVED